jgi:hypothetical protein
MGVSVWVALSECEVWLRGSLAGAVAWLVSVSLVVEVGLFRLGFRVVAVGWPLGGALFRVAVRRCRMCCIMLVAGGGFILALGFGVVEGWVVGFLLVRLPGVMGGKSIWRVVCDRSRRDLAERVGRAAGGVWSWVVVSGSIVVGWLWGT